MALHYPPTFKTPERPRINARSNSIWYAVPREVYNIRCSQIRNENFRNSAHRYEKTWESGKKHDPESGIHLAIYEALIASDNGISQAEIFADINGASQDYLREMRNQGIIYYNI
jgi:hypothetical protein